MKRSSVSSKDALLGAIAPPTPAIIDYIKQRNFKRLDKIVADWEKTGLWGYLLADLGLSKRPLGRPRTQRKVDKECEIVNAVIYAAMNGIDPPFAVAAKLQKVPAREARDAWNKWSQYRLSSLRIMAKHCDGRGFTVDAAAHRLAIKILEKHKQ